MKLEIPTRSSVIDGCNSPHSRRFSVTTTSVVRYLRNHTDGTASRTLPAQPPQCATLYSRTGYAPLSVYLISLMQATLLSTRSLQTRLCTARHPCAHSFLNFRKSKNYLRLTASLCLEVTSWLLPCLHRTPPLFRVSPSSPLPSLFI